MIKPTAQASSDRTVPRVVVLDMRYHAMKNYNYLVIDPGTRQAVIVDPAWEIEKVHAAVAESQSTLRGVLITHSHHDHIHLARSVADAYDCPIWMSSVEIASSGYAAARLAGIGNAPWNVGHLLIEPIATPGHTPGSTCYRIGDNLFTGDVLFAEGCGFCPDLASAHAMFASLQHLKKKIEARVRVFPGHSYGQPPGRPMSQLLRDNIYLQISNRDAFAAFRLRSGQDRARMFDFH